MCFVFVGVGWVANPEQWGYSITVIKFRLSTFQLRYINETPSGLFSMNLLILS